MTSFAAVAFLRRLYGIKKAGHCGTLDPLADGVLPVFLGRATAAIPYTDAYDKTYRVEFRVGRSTTTLDREGETDQIKTPPEPLLQQWLAADAQYLARQIAGLQGWQTQQPPLYSAVKIDGRPLYSYARNGSQPPRLPKPRQIEVKQAAFLAAWLDPQGDAAAPLVVAAAFRVSKGTYIRSLVYDLAQSFGYPAYTTRLTRTQAGPFTLAQSLTPTQLEAAAARQPELGLDALLLPPEAALKHIPVVKLTAEDTRRLLYGQFLDLPPACRPYQGQQASDPPLLALPRQARQRYRAVGPEGLSGIVYIRRLPDNREVLAAERMFVHLDD
ncbi:MAG: tRNA pseudouridine(55) synthase TruB [Oscillospiraceae bacterium]|nr:tRNA pseudouridine(55) synthase TruB [Oscillospiraceae bacterium]MDD4367500.1 tRNA pseudouridine(55) synthase TruB [Oscillospiraceae bacterium]